MNKKESIDDSIITQRNTKDGKIKIIKLKDNIGFLGNDYKIIHYDLKKIEPNVNHEKFLYYIILFEKENLNKNALIKNKIEYNDSINDLTDFKYDNVLNRYVFYTKNYNCFYENNKKKYHFSFFISIEKKDFQFIEKYEELIIDLKKKYDGIIFDFDILNFFLIFIYYHFDYNFELNDINVLNYKEYDIDDIKDDKDKKEVFDINNRNKIKFFNYKNKIHFRLYKNKEIIIDTLKYFENYNEKIEPFFYLKNKDSFYDLPYNSDNKRFPIFHTILWYLIFFRKTKII
jgi:hypothetical protein